LVELDNTFTSIGTALVVSAALFQRSDGLVW